MPLGKPLFSTPYDMVYGVGKHRENALHANMHDNHSSFQAKNNRTTTSNMTNADFLLK